MKKIHKEGKFIAADFQDEERAFIKKHGFKVMYVWNNKKIKTAN